MNRALFVLPAAASASASGTQAYVLSDQLQHLANDLHVSVGTAGQVATCLALALAGTQMPRHVASPA